MCLNRLFQPFACCLLLLALCSFKNESTISLAGKWAFQIDREDKGETEQWYLHTLTDNIQLPGSMAENRKGDEISLTTQWTGSIYDSSFYFNPRLAKYRQPGNIHIPFWLSPTRYYVGAAWYQRPVDVPPTWSGKRIILFLERAHIQTKVWVDDRQVGMQNSLVAPHQYDLTSYLSPGRHRISIRIDNRITEINVGPDAHSVTDHTQGNWNGIVGKIQLQASTPVFIEDLQVFPDLKNNNAQVTLQIKNNSKVAFEGQVILKAGSSQPGSKQQVVSVQAGIKLAGYRSSTVVLTLSMGSGMQTWDEFHPFLYQLTAALRQGSQVVNEAQTVFGMREFKIEKRSFLINGRPVFLRGTLNNCEFPLTGYPATDTGSWLHIMKIVKAHGLNHLRFHSWCPPEAAFQAADQEGIYLQPEGPSWPNHGPQIGLGQPIDSFLYEETRRMAKMYGNHPSFCMLSAGNEPAGNQVPYLNAFVNYWKARDSRRVYTGMSVGGSWPVVPEAQYQVRGGVRGLAWEKLPETVSDFSAGIARFDVPFVAHEIGQYCVFPDFDEIKEYTGVYRAKNFELFQQDLADHGMADQAHDFMMASGKLQALCYKSEIEKMLRTPGYAGFQLLGLQDFPGQGTALVGVLNAFWKSKGYISADQYARFCNATVPLASLPKFVFTSNETLDASIEVAHWGAAPLTNPEFVWAIKTESGQVINRGAFKPGHIGFGNGQLVGQIHYPLDSIRQAMHLKLEVNILHTAFANGWDIWVYPAAMEKPAANVYYTTTLDDSAKQVLENGGKVFFNAAGQVVKGKEVVMYFQPVFWNTSWFQMKPPHVTGMLIQDKSAAFHHFPTNYYSNLQWWEIAQKAQVMNLEDFPAGFKPLVQPIDTWFMNRRLGLIFEAQVGNGKLLVCSADLHPNIGPDKPAARQLFASLMEYMATDQFQPGSKISFEVVKDLLVSPSKIQFSTYTKDSPDELKPTSNQNKPKN